MLHSTLVRCRRTYPHATKVIIGSASRNKRNPDWLPTTARTVNAFDRATYAQWWQPGTISAFLAEHVWEHLTEEQAVQADKIIFEFLKPGGWLRLAVPDGYTPDPDYIDHVKVGGDNQYHQQLYTYKTMVQQLESAGFQVKLLEYFDEHGQYHHNPWDITTGFIKRSYANRMRRHLSIVIDAIKPQ